MLSNHLRYLKPTIFKTYPNFKSYYTNETQTLKAFPDQFINFFVSMSMWFTWTRLIWLRNWWLAWWPSRITRWGTPRLRHLCPISLPVHFRLFNTLKHHHKINLNFQINLLTVVISESIFWTWRKLQSNQIEKFFENFSKFRIESNSSWAFRERFGASYNHDFSWIHNIYKYIQIIQYRVLHMIVQHFINVTHLSATKVKLDLICHHRTHWPSW